MHPIALTNAEKARIIRTAMGIIATPKTWCQGTYAKAGDGKNTFWYARTACRWCALGACRLAALRLSYIGLVSSPARVRALVKLEVDLFPATHISMLNDTRSHAEVLAALNARATELEAA